MAAPFVTRPAAVADTACQPLNRSEFTRRAIDFAASLPWEEGENPFVRDDCGGVFLRFDGLEIRNSGPRDPGGVNVGFLWQGTVMCWLNLPGARIEGGAVLKLNGIEGRQRVSLS